jgi:translation elongation factor EF-1alpha
MTPEVVKKYTEMMKTRGQGNLAFAWLSDLSKHERYALSRFSVCFLHHRCAGTSQSAFWSLEGIEAARRNHITGISTLGRGNVH